MQYHFLKQRHYIIVVYKCLFNINRRSFRKMSVSARRLCSKNLTYFIYILKCHSQLLLIQLRTLCQKCLSVIVKYWKQRCAALGSSSNYFRSICLHKSLRFKKFSDGIQGRMSNMENALQNISTKVDSPQIQPRIDANRRYFTFNEKRSCFLCYRKYLQIDWDNLRTIRRFFLRLNLSSYC